MKRCPECRRDYYDDSLLYCLDDGSGLLDGPASVPAAMFGNSAMEGLPAEPATAIFAKMESAAGARSDTAILQAPATESDPTPGGSLTHRAAKPVAVLVIAAAMLITAFFGYRYFAASASLQINSIAVLPFQNKSGDPNTEY